MTQPIGIFDSGIGGLSVLKALRTEMPNQNFIYIADSGHAPYGERDDAYVVARSLAIAAHLVKQNIKALVVACNTATAAAIDVLRAAHPMLPIIGVEPALKPAVAISQTKHIAVMATRSTLASARFAALLAAHEAQARFLLLPCDGLAEAIERSAQQSNTTELIAACAQYTKAVGIFSSENGFKAACSSTQNIDTIVLGCTHYPLASAHIQALLGPGVQLLDNGQAIARQTRRVLGNPLLTSAQPRSTNLVSTDLVSIERVSIELVSTGRPDALHAAALAWLGFSADVQTLCIL